MLFKPYEKFNLIDKIATKLQAEYNTSRINMLLADYGIETDTVTIVPSKRDYVMGLLKGKSDFLIAKLACDLSVDLPSKTTHTATDFKSILELNQLHSVMDDFNRAIDNIIIDPDVAITAASSTLESICKAILEFFNEPYPTAESIQPLINKTYKLLNLSADQHAEEQIKKILGGLNSVATGIGTLRTKNSAAHGHGLKRTRLSQRHVRLVVNSCSTIGLFILETYYENHLIKQ
jgi:hypothetical protein